MSCDFSSVTRRANVIWSQGKSVSAKSSHECSFWSGASHIQSEEAQLDPIPSQRAQRRQGRNCDSSHHHLKPSLGTTEPHNFRVCFQILVYFLNDFYLQDDATCGCHLIFAEVTVIIYFGWGSFGELQLSNRKQNDYCSFLTSSDLRWQDFSMLGCMLTYYG